MRRAFSFKNSNCVVNRRFRCSLRVPLTDESAEVRAASLRALRTLLRRPSDARCMRRLGIPHLVARGMDLDLDNRAERVQALRVARRMAYAAPEQFPEAVARWGGNIKKAS